MKPFFLGLLCLSTHFVQGALLEPELRYSEGWKRSDVQTKLTAEDPKGTAFLTDTIKAEEIDVWQFGLKGTLATPCDFFECWWLNQFYLRGFAYWGWGNEGHFRETVDDVPSLGTPTKTKADIHSVRTQNFTIGLGWLFPVNTCYGWEVGIGPVLGYSYDKIEFKIKKARNSLTGESDRTFDNLKLPSRFEGPWLGIDLVVSYCDWKVNTGYEYHWITDWKGAYELAVPDSDTGFSDRRKADDGHGSVFYVDVLWSFWDNWELGLGFNYRNLRADDGKEVPKAGSFEAVDLPSTEFDRINFSKWESCGFTIDIGYVF